MSGARTIPCQYFANKSCDALTVALLSAFLPYGPRPGSTYSGYRLDLPVEHPSIVDLLCDGPRIRSYSDWCTFITELFWTHRAVYFLLLKDFGIVPNPDDAAILKTLRRPTQEQPGGNVVNITKDKVQQPKPVAA